MPGHRLQEKPTSGPRLGLALGSGAARGWAHIGVLRALDKAAIAPDIICGTSIGALVGGIYLAGHLDLLENWACELNRMRLVRLLDPRMSGGGLIGGERLMRLIHANVGDASIENLPAPFVAVATDLATGHEVWFQEGPLIDAMRASFALPGLFPPVRFGRRWLADGALVNPVPVSVCRAMGAQLVIAVNLNADIAGGFRRPTSAESPSAPDAATPETDAIEGEGRVKALARQLFGADPNAPSVFSVMVSSLNIIQDRLSRSRLAGDPPDFALAPRLGHIGLLEFDRAREAIDAAFTETEAALPDIRAGLDALG